MNIKQTILSNKLFEPILLLRAYLIKNTLLGKKYLKYRASLAFRHRFNRDIDWKNPKDLNEKIQWLKFHSDISLWTDLADKYKVREYVKECGLEHLLVKLYGVWENPEDIDFDKLPESFVLKTNNSCGTNLIVKEKKNLDTDQAIGQLKKWILESRRIITLEPHYFKIKPLIIAEEFLSTENQDIGSNSLIDYKVWCINGEPQFVVAFYDRNTSPYSVELFDIDWTPHPEYRIFTEKAKLGTKQLSKPEVLNEMVLACRKLSMGFPQVRIDFYIVNQKLYFGEMTFTSQGGSNYLYTQAFLNMLGEKIKLPKQN